MIHTHKHGRMEWRELLVEIVGRLRPDCYVELGCQRGHTFNAIAPRVKRAVAVDMSSKAIGHVHKLPHVEMYCMLTKDFIEQWKDPIDILFIDADHSEEGVTTDFRGMLPYVIEGTGLIFLHDAHPMTKIALKGSMEVWRLAQKIHKLDMYKDLEIVTIPGPNAGLSIIRKAPHHLYTEEGQWLKR